MQQPQSQLLFKKIFANLKICIVQFFLYQLILFHLHCHWTASDYSPYLYTLSSKSQTSIHLVSNFFLKCHAHFILLNITWILHINLTYHFIVSLLFI